MKTLSLHAGSLAATITLDDSGALSAVELPAEVPADFDAAALADLAAQLDSLPIAPDRGGPFVQKVRARMREIPRGSAMTYGELAAAVGSPRAARAVGQACATNPLLVAVPCHRVVAENGLGGFALGLDWKRKLLELETEAA